MALAAAAVRRRKIVGRASPRMAPPVPARHELPAFRESAEAMGISLMPWQETAAKYLTARGRDGLLFREVAIVVARQNGKTTLMKPHIVRSLLAGRKITHIANNRELPRHMFGIIADALSSRPELFPKRRGRTIWPRYGSGQEEIVLENGGSYRIAASGGGRGWPNDLVIIDELREMHDFDVMHAAEPTLTMSPEPQIVYLSNMGAEDSVVLNEIRDRAGVDPSLGYLEWSAAPERDPSDVDGWAESNPALGHYPSVMTTLEAAHRKALLKRENMVLFEMEHLCRYQPSDQPTLVSLSAFAALNAELDKPVRPVLALKMDPSGTRASAVIAWQQADGSIACRVEADVTGEPIDTDRLGTDLAQRAIRLGVGQIAFDDWTDKELARYFPKARPIIGREYANASENFVRVVESGRLRWDGNGAVGDDLAFTSRKAHESGAWQAVPMKEDRPVTAAQAAIRAVWLASGPKPIAPRVY